MPAHTVPHGISGAIEPTWQDLLNFIEQEGRLKEKVRGAKQEARQDGRARRTIESDLSVSRAFLVTNGYALEERVDADFLDRLDRGIQLRDLKQAPGIVLASAAADDRAYRSRLASLVRAHRALTLTDFASLLRQCLKSSRLSYAKVASECGRPRHWLANLLVRRSGGVTGMTVGEAAQLDKVLGAKGKLFAAYGALTQQAAFEPVTPAMDQVLGRTGFAGQLANWRRGLNLTLDALLDKVEELSGVRVPGSHLSHWEQGYNLPCQDMENVVLALDKVFGAGGKLLRAWKEENPQKKLPSYALPRSQWPDRLRAQFDGLVDYKTGNPDELPRSDATRGDRWTGAASKNRCVEALERYFGFLTSQKGFAAESLSLTLIADWTLVKAFFDFVRGRAGRTSYSQDAVAITSVFINLYGWYLPHLANEAARESYWADRLPAHATGIDESVPGVPRPYEVKLLDFGESWNYHLFLTRSGARDFLKQGHFEIGRLVGRAAPLLESEIGVAEIAAVVEQLVRKLPRRILCRRAAIHCRQLAVAVLVLARCFRPGTLAVLRNGQVMVQPDRRVWLNITEKQFKTRGKGGSKLGVLGQLPDYDFMHEAVRRFKLEARPILLGDAALRGNKDAGYFLTPAYWRAPAGGKPQLVPGGPFSGELLRRDARAILGYHPYAQRYLFASDAWRHNGSKQDIANVLMNTVPMVEKRYIRETAASRTKMVNAIVEGMILGQSAAGETK
jgi:hypothetical protein